MYNKSAFTNVTNNFYHYSCLWPFLLIKNSQIDEILIFERKKCRIAKTVFKLLTFAKSAKGTNCRPNLISLSVKFRFSGPCRVGQQDRVCWKKARQCFIIFAKISRQLLAVFGPSGSLTTELRRLKIFSGENIQIAKATLKRMAFANTIKITFSI